MSTGSRRCSTAISGARFDAVVRGGRVVTPDGVRDVDVAIDGSRIAALGSALQGARTIDASGLLVLPGGVDAHVHAPPLGLSATANEPGGPEGAARMSRAAVLGGTTTLIDFAFAAPGEPLRDGIESKVSLWRESHCDHAFHVLLRG